MPKYDTQEKCLEHQIKVAYSHLVGRTKISRGNYHAFLLADERIEIYYDNPLELGMETEFILSLQNHDSNHFIDSLIAILKAVKENRI